MKTALLITARLKSARLKEKVLLEVKGKSYLEHLVERGRKMEEVESIIVCTSTNPQDNDLEKEAQKLGIKCFRGSEEDVLERIYGAAEKFKVDFILSVTADCPLVDPKYADKMVESFSNNNADLITAFNLPHGAYLYGIKTEALKKVIEIKDDDHTEVWGRYFTDTDLFNVYELPVEDKHNRPSLRMTLDYSEDDQFFRAVFDALYKGGELFSLDELLDFLDDHPEVVALNDFCESLYLKRHKRQSSFSLKSRYDVSKVVLIGAGSIGQRHCRNLRQLGITDILAFRTNKGHFQKLPEELELKETNDWSEIENFQPDIAIVANPTSLHLETAKRVFPLVKGIFIDKPLSHNLDGLQEFYENFENSRKNVFIGYNVPHHPIIKSIDDALSSDRFGKVISCQCTIGHWLPAWHPYEDYKKSFSANSNLGGGVALTLIHEVQLAEHFMGKVEYVSGAFPKSDLLELDVDTQANIMCEHANGGISQLHMDYIQKQWHRAGIINCEKGHIHYDFREGIVKAVSENNDSTEILWQDKNYDFNKMYIDMMSLFIQYVSEGRIRHEFDLVHAYNNLATVCAAFESYDKKLWAKPEKLQKSGVTLYD